MAHRVQDKKPKRNKAAQSWIDDNVADQKVRYRAIVKEMEDLWPQRKKWYAEFLKVVQTRGFNMDGDILVKIPKKDVPKEPKRKHKVVF
ncbi:MAG: hypothetical protein ACR2QB_01050 [Gammaproteobacteria bacterium]